MLVFVFCCSIGLLFSAISSLQYEHRTVQMAYKPLTAYRQEIIVEMPTGIPAQPYVIVKRNLKPYDSGGIPIHHFGYIIKNPDFCLNNSRLSYFIYVYSAPYEFEQRRRIRETWGRSEIITNSNGKLAFFLARSKNSTVMENITTESNTYHDIVLADFIDSYSNLTFKGVMALEWMNLHCNSAQYYIKTDTDILLDTYHLKPSIEQHIGGVNRSFLCKVAHKSLVLRDHAKWAVPRIQFPEGRYPTYCQGSLWIFTADILLELYLATYSVPFIYVEDVYTSGLLARSIGSIRHIGNLGLVRPYGASLRDYTDKDSAKPLASALDDKTFRQAWAAITENARERSLTDYDKWTASASVSLKEPLSTLRLHLIVLVHVSLCLGNYRNTFL